MIKPGLDDDQSDLRQLLIHHRRESAQGGARVYGQLRIFHRFNLDPLPVFQIGNHQLRSTEDHRVSGARGTLLSGDSGKGQALLCEQIAP